MVVDDPAAAMELVASGFNVVLIVPEGTEIGPVPQGGGRLAAMIGDPRDTATRAAAEAMDAELFGSA